MSKVLAVSLIAALALVPAQGALASAKKWDVNNAEAVDLILEVKGKAEAKKISKAEKKAKKEKKKRNKTKAKKRNKNWSDEHAAFVDQARNTNSGHGNGGETPDFENGGWKSFPSETFDRDPANSRLQCQGGKNENRC